MVLFHALQSVLEYGQPSDYVINAAVDNLPHKILQGALNQL